MFLVKGIKFIFWSGLFCVGMGGATAATLYYQALGDMPNVANLKDVTFETPMKVYTKDKKLIAEFGESKRIPVSFDKIPDKLKKAFLAIEDTRFYDHQGIDPIGILRASLVALTSSQAKQGASTITQQVARNFYLTREKTLKRKLKEIFISLRIEQVLNKDEIFELYLNKIALGHRSNGVAAAAQVYYGKNLDELTLAEMATIAGLPKAPSTLNPISHPNRSKARRHLVLERMYNLGFITKEEYDEADNAPYKTYFHAAKVEAYAPYVAEKARQLVLEKYGESAYTDGLEIYTTIDSNAQKAAHDAIFLGVNAYDRRHGYRGPIANLNDLAEAKSEDFDLQDYLYKKDIYHYIHPAVVTKIDDKSKRMTIKAQKQDLEIGFDNIKWASKFINDKRQGNAPKKISDVLKENDVIFYYVNEKGEAALAQVPEVEAALVALNQYDGAIEAMVGGYDFAKSKFDRTYQATRQTGSNFKPFLYSAAVAKGINVNSIFQDEPIKTWDPGARKWWEPKNSPNRYDGPMTLREGLARSKNVVSIRLIRQVGVQNAVEHIQKFGFEIPRSQQVEAMALGSVEATPLELVRGYAVFANGGYKVEPYLVTKIVKNGQVIYNYQPQTCDPKEPDNVNNSIALEYKTPVAEDSSKAPQVLSHANAYIISDIMRSVIYGGKGFTGPYWGTGGRASTTTGRQDLHGKTGTTNNVHDAWFSGFNGDIVATAWMGFDTDRDLGYSRTQGSEGGAYSALPIWADFIKHHLKGKPQAPLPIPSGLSKCTNSGVSDWCVSNGVFVNDESFEELNSSTQTEIDTSNITEENLF